MKSIRLLAADEMLSGKAPGMPAVSHFSCIDELTVLLPASLVTSLNMLELDPDVLGINAS